MNMDNLDRQLQHAYQFIQHGQRAEAYLILAPLCRQNPYSADAWWLMAHALEDLSYVQKALRRVLAIDPFYPQAAERLAQVNQQIAAKMAAVARAPEINPYYIPPSLRTGQPSPAVRKHTNNGWTLTFIALSLMVSAVIICVGLIVYLQQPDNTLSEAVSQVMDNQGIIPFIGPPVSTPDPSQFGDTYWQGIGDGVTMDTQSIEGRYLRFFEFPIKVYVDGANDARWQNSVDAAIAEINAHVPIEETKSRAEADIVMEITSQSKVQEACSNYSLTRVVGCASISYQPGILKPIIFGEAYISTSTNNPTGTIVHELLHAIGVAAHSPDPNDIMYYQETNYIITRMSQRDINTLNRLYASPSLDD